MQTFTELVKDEMKKRKINVIKLARVTNLSQSYLYDLLKGNKRWNEDTLFLVCKALGITIKFEVESKAS